MSKLISLFTLMRLKQWVKNIFIVFPLIFSGQLYDFNLLRICFLTLFGFCLVSSAIYILNDFYDREQDRVHPKKSKRVFAQAAFRPIEIKLSFAGLLLAGTGICFMAGGGILYAALVYILLHLAYNRYAKKVVIMDVIFIAAGFQIRIWAGSLAAGVLPSVWLQLCVFLLALFLGFTKRRNEITTLREHAPEHRSVLKHYTTYLLDQIIIICSTLAIVFYGLYAISSDIVLKTGDHNMVYSIGFVIYGIFRYLYLIHVKKLGDDPGDVIFKDKPFLLNLILWCGFIVFILYLP